MGKKRGKYRPWVLKVEVAHLGGGAGKRITNNKKRSWLWGWMASKGRGGVKNGGKER